MTLIRTKILSCERVLLGALLGGQLFLVGCGGGASQDDMRRYAIRRKPDEEVSETPTQVVGNNNAEIARSEVIEAEPRKAEATSAPAAKAPTAAAVASSATSGPSTSGDAAPRSEEHVAPPNVATPAAAPPAEPLTPVERRRRTADNLTKLGEAWRAYLNDKRCLPGPVLSVTKEPLLSWRVELLPYLGLQSLYDAFHLDEAWDSPHNITLLDQIPGVFQSPERFDTQTNYLALSLSGTTAYQERRRLSASKVEDGLENTLALVEVDDEQAVPWTQPAEFPLAMGSPLESLGKLRKNGLFAVWSDGTASWIDGAVNPELFAKACTIDSGDGFRGALIASELDAGIALPDAPSTDTPAVEMVAGGPGIARSSTAVPVPEIAEPKRPSLSDAQASLELAGTKSSQPSFKKNPIPSAAELKVSRDLLRELYQGDYAAAQTEPQRLQLARKMLNRLPDLGGDTPGQYALLELVAQIAIQAGGVDQALDAVDQLRARFELPGDRLLDAFEKLSRTARDRGAVGRLLEEADSEFADFVFSQQYAAAERISQLAVAAASKLNDQEAVTKFTERRQWASEAKVLEQAAEAGLAILEQNPEDPRANGDVGKFLCLIKNDWENGLVILANGHDRSLKRLAAMELGDLSDPMRKLELADLWWREAESASPPFKATLQTRAKHWYEQTLPGLPAGLVRIRVERRLEEITDDGPST